MCLLMVTLGELPKREYLLNACTNNSDGYGFAVHHGDWIETFRSMDAETTIDLFYQAMGTAGDRMGMFHARFTTHGVTAVENNHPFKVDGRDDIILAHNGMLPIAVQAGDTRSDTRIFAEQVLGAIGVTALDDRSMFSTLEEFASGSKVAIFSTAPELRDSVYILNEDLGHWEGDIWWSNTGYRYSYGKSGYSSSYRTGYYGHSSLWDDDYATAGTIIGKHWSQDMPTASKQDTLFEETTCMVCLAGLDEDSYHDGVCYTCNSCLDCYEHMVSCLCYNPEVAVAPDGSPMRLSDYDWE